MQDKDPDDPQDIVIIHMPALGESITEGTVSRWLKRLGDHVVADEPLVDVYTDKTDVEVSAPASGYLREIGVAEDETVLVGAVLGIIELISRRPQQSELGLIEPGSSDPSPKPGASLTEPLQLVAPEWIAEVDRPTVARWLKHENDRIAFGEPLLEITTQYGDIEVPSPINGILRCIMIAEDGAVQPNAILALMGSVAA